MPAMLKTGDRFRNDGNPRLRAKARWALTWLLDHLQSIAEEGREAKRSFRSDCRFANLATMDRQHSRRGSLMGVVGKRKAEHIRSAAIIWRRHSKPRFVARQLEGGVRTSHDVRKEKLPATDRQGEGKSETTVRGFCHSLIWGFEAKTLLTGTPQVTLSAGKTACKTQWGRLHGGIFATLLTAAMGTGVRKQLAPEGNPSPTTEELKVKRNFFRQVGRHRTQRRIGKPVVQRGAQTMGYCGVHQ